MSTVTQPQAKRLAALGYRGTFPSLYWWSSSQLPTPRLMLRESELDGTWGMHYADTVTMLAAPVYVSGDGQGGVFDWLEYKYGVQWSRNRPSLWRSDKDEWVVVIWQDGKLDGHAEKVIGRDTASDVLDAILDRLEAAQLTAKEAP